MMGFGAIHIRIHIGFVQTNGKVSLLGSCLFPPEGRE
jgi:hypothetical protein